MRSDKGVLRRVFLFVLPSFCDTEWYSHGRTPRVAAPSTLSIVAWIANVDSVTTAREAEKLTKQHRAEELTQQHRAEVRLSATHTATYSGSPTKCSNKQVK